MSAPVCPISRDQAVPGMPGRTLPFPPRALDMPSLIAATNALRDLVLGMFGPGVPLNNMPYGSVNLKGNGSAKQDPGQTIAVQNDWEEIKRDEEHLRVFHGGDRTVYVDVVRINNLLFHWEHNDVFMPEDSFEWAYRPDVSLVDWAAVLSGPQQVQT